MDKGTVGLKNDADSDEVKQAAAIEKEIEIIRENLDGLVSELDHRRHQLNPRRLMANHPMVMVLAGLALVGAVVGGISVHRMRLRKHNSWRERAKRLRANLAHLVDEPEKLVVTKPSIMRKVGTAAAAAAAAMVARSVAGRMLTRAR